MDFAARLKDFDSGTLVWDVVRSFAKASGIGELQLRHTVLPTLRNADVLGYTEGADGEIKGVEEYVGVTGTLVEQAIRVLSVLRPTPAEMALLHSVELAAFAPLVQSQHLDQLTGRGFPEEVAQHGLRLALAAGINQRVPSAELREAVVFNPYVWGTGQIQIAGFLRSLPPAERDALLGICQQASECPGLALPALVGDQNVINSARKVGLLQATTVKSSAGGGSSQTYVFSPLLESEDDAALTTEALHQRKLFVAHILFGVERAKAGLGRITDPELLVRRLVERGQVGPATNIGTDYHLVEARGIVRVEPAGTGDRAFLRLVKPEVVKDSLDWLQRAGTGGNGSPSAKLLRAPSSFVTPEEDRATIGDQGAADEVTTAAVLRLREEMLSATRQDHVF